MPSRKEGGSLLTDLERQAFQKQGVELAPTAREDGFLQRYYLYLMLARPSRMLALSCVSFDQAGKTRRPSSLFSEIRRIFPDLGMEEAGRVPGRIGSRQEGKERLIQGLREWREGEEPAEFLEVYRRFASDPESAALLKALREAAFYSGQEKGIGRAAARALYGTTLHGQRDPAGTVRLLRLRPFSPLRTGTYGAAGVRGRRGRYGQSVSRRHRRLF